MDVDIKNPEGYVDTVPYEAIKNTENYAHQYRPLVYVCSKYSGDIKGNTKKARMYSRFVVDQGGIPVAPHLLFPQFMDESTERDLAIFMDIALLSKCKELWVFGSEISNGMQIEIDWATKHNRTIKYFSTDLKEVI